MKQSYKFLTSEKGPDKKGDTKVVDAIFVRVYADNKKEALEKVKLIAETKYCWLHEINECHVDIDESNKIMARQNKAFDIQQKAFDWLKKKCKIK